MNTLKKPDFFYKRDSIISIILSIFIANIYLITKRLYDIFSKIKKPVHFKNKTICVGNIVVGGSGKTPVCIAIAKYLTGNKNKVCFISKGYGRVNKDDVSVPYKCGNIFNYSVTGDEPILLSEISDVCIVKNRNNVPFELDGYSHLIFDDGFSDESIHFDIKILVFDCNFFIGNGRLLPAGPLRDTLNKSIQKTNYIILTDYNEDKHSNIVSFLSKFIDNSKILTTKVDVKNKPTKDVRYIAFAGIGENSKFLKTLQENGFDIVEFIGFPDHYPYKEYEIEKIMEKASANDMKIITTAKDFIRIPNEYRKNIETLEIEHIIDNVESIFS